MAHNIDIDVGRSIQAEIGSRIHRAAWFDETVRVLNAYLSDKHGCIIHIGTLKGCVVMDRRGGFVGKPLFSSPSYTSCLEYALAMPLIESKTE